MTYCLAFFFFYLYTKNRMELIRLSAVSRIAHPFPRTCNNLTLVPRQPTWNIINTIGGRIWFRFAEFTSFSVVVQPLITEQCPRKERDDHQYTTVVGEHLSYINFTYTNYIYTIICKHIMCFCWIFTKLRTIQDLIGSLLKFPH